MMFPKRKRIKDKQLIRDIKKIGYCEYCGSRYYLQTHHIKTKVSGGDDIPENLICLCVDCHTKAHAGNISKAKLKEIVERRLEHENRVHSELTTDTVGSKCEW